MVSMKTLEIHTVCWSYQGNTWDFFQNFSSISVLKNEARKVGKRDLGIFEVEKHAIKVAPKGGGAAWIFLGVPSHIRCNWWGSKLVHWLERVQNQINYKI